MATTEMDIFVKDGNNLFEKFITFLMIQLNFQKNAQEFYLKKIFFRFSEKEPWKKLF